MAAGFWLTWMRTSLGGGGTPFALAAASVVGLGSGTESGITMSGSCRVSPDFTVKSLSSQSPSLFIRSMRYVAPGINARESATSFFIRDRPVPVMLAVEVGDEILIG